MAQLTCATCGAPLPAGAMFCGECGRAVVPAALAPAVDPPAEAGKFEPFDARADRTPSVSADSASTKSPLPPPVLTESALIAPPSTATENPTGMRAVSDVLGENSAESDAGSTGDTTDLSALRPHPPGSDESGKKPPEEKLPEEKLPEEKLPEKKPPERDVVIDQSPVCELCGARMGVNDIFCGECGHVSGIISRAFSSTRKSTLDGPLDPSNVEPAADSVHRPVHYDELEATRMVPPRGGRERFVLQFSTGESVTASGSGLVGRNPIPEPGEYFDQLVRVIDPTRSVSKTHLEFGQDTGSFWVRDRYSGNGSVLREPDAAARRCDPGKRYPVVRGTRIDIGEQFVIVS